MRERVRMADSVNWWRCMRNRPMVTEGTGVDGGSVVKRRLKKTGGEKTSLRGSGYSRNFDWSEVRDHHSDLVMVRRRKMRGRPDGAIVLPETDGWPDVVQGGFWADDGVEVGEVV